MVWARLLETLIHALAIYILTIPGGLPLEMNLVLAFSLQKFMRENYVRQWLEAYDTIVVNTAMRVFAKQLEKTERHLIAHSPFMIALSGLQHKVVRIFDPRSSAGKERRKRKVNQ